MTFLGKLLTQRTYLTIFSQTAMIFPLSSGTDFGVFTSAPSQVNEIIMRPALLHDIRD